MGEFLASLLIVFIVGGGITTMAIGTCIQINEAKFVPIYFRYPIFLLIISAIIVMFVKSLIPIIVIGFKAI